MGDELTQDRTERRRLAATRHGGAAGLEQIRAGLPASGLARDALIAVENEIAEHGHESVIESRANRLQAVADLYWWALVKASNEGDLEKTDLYARRFGWLQPKAIAELRAAAALHGKSGAVDYEKLVEAQDNAAD